MCVWISGCAFGLSIKIERALRRSDLHKVDRVEATAQEARSHKYEEQLPAASASHLRRSSDSLLRDHTVRPIQARL